MYILNLEGVFSRHWKGRYSNFTVFATQIIDVLKGNGIILPEEKTVFCIHHGIGEIEPFGSGFLFAVTKKLDNI